jgi:DNA-binding GntR family transcriptional regulator
MDAYESIKTLIVEGDLQPGLRLTEEFLSAELNTSRTPIREALKRLEAEGLVTPVKKRGVEVRVFTTDDVRQIYDLRALLEGYAATHAALLRTDEQIAEMTEAVENYEKTIQSFSDTRKSIQDIVYYNGMFHRAVHASANNPHLDFMMSKVIVLPLVFRSFYWYSMHEISDSLSAHKQILRAIASKDPDWARAAMSGHIYRGRDHVLGHIIGDLSSQEKISTGFQRKGREEA